MNSFFVVSERPPLTSKQIVGRKNTEEDMAHSSSMVSALLLPEEGCRDLIKFLLLLLWNTVFLPDTLHCISSRAPAQVGVVQEMLSVRASHLVLPCPSAVYIPSRFRGKQGAPRCSPGSLQFALLNLTCSKESLKKNKLFRSRINLTLEYTACQKQTLNWNKTPTLLFCSQFGYFHLARGGFSTYSGNRNGNTPPSYHSDNCHLHLPALWTSDNCMENAPLLSTIIKQSPPASNKIEVTFYFTSLF